MRASARQYNRTKVRGAFAHWLFGGQVCACVGLRGPRRRLIPGAELAVPDGPARDSVRGSSHGRGEWLHEDTGNEPP